MTAGPAPAARTRCLLAAAAVAVALVAGCLRTGQAPPSAGPTVAGVPVVVSETVLSDRMLDLTVSSPALRRTAWVRLLLPTRWAADRGRRWPVLYLLKGCCDDYGGASFSGIVHTRLSSARTQWYRQLLRWEGADPDALWGSSQAWAAHNPYDLAPRLRGTQLFLSVGDGRPGPCDLPGAPVDEVEAALAAENAALPCRLSR